MPTIDPMIGLRLDGEGDDYDVVADETANWTLLATMPGVLITTDITTVLGWSAGRKGRFAYDKTSGLTWVWDGAAFQRAFPLGKIGRNKRTTNITTTNVDPTFTIAVQQAVTIPAGGRDIEIVVEVPSAYSTPGVTALCVFRGATALQKWQVLGDNTATNLLDDRGAPFSVVDEAPAAGAATYSIQFAVAAGYVGTATLAATAFSPIRITIKEI